MNFLDILGSNPETFEYQLNRKLKYKRFRNLALADVVEIWWSLMQDISQTLLQVSTWRTGGLSTGIHLALFHQEFPNA